jgi:methionyl-tRNA synthetase
MGALQMVSKEDFEKVEMKVGRVLSVEDHPNADKLMVMRVDVGEQSPRTLVAGLKPYYRKEELQGKLVVVVTNLDPVRLRGIESHGMLLAAQDDDQVVVLTLDKEIAAGSTVL